MDQLASGGDRSAEVHFNSIEVDPVVDIRGETFLLLDDITTSGNSLYACKRILLNHGASKVEMMALGKTVDNGSSKWAFTIESRKKRRLSFAE